ncbi:MAG: hypothetical protein SR1Q7_07255 [Quinella sp. 1Q7]|nr:hypothetical protein [Quinella sp. 1Q7]
MLAKGFAFVRVDFYEIDGHVYFGEITFTSAAGNLHRRRPHKFERPIKISHVGNLRRGFFCAIITEKFFNRL